MDNRGRRRFGLPFRQAAVQPLDRSPFAVGGSGRRRREGLGLRHRQSEIHSRQHERLDRRPGPRFLPAAHPLRRGAHAVYPLPEPRAGQRRRHLLRREDGGRPRGSLPQRAARTPARSPAVLSRAAQGHEVAGQRRTDPRHAADGFPPSRSWLRWCRSSWPPRRVWL